MKTVPASTRGMMSGLGRKFFCWFLVIALIPVVIVSYVFYEAARENLLRDTGKSLLGTLELKKKYIEAFFDEKINDLALQASMSENVQFLAALRKSRKNLGLSGKEIIDLLQGSGVIDQYRRDLERFIEMYGYRDVLLIDTDGKILYTITNEEKWGQNVLSGALADSLFAGACRTALTKGRMCFSDLERHTAASNELDSFLVQPVRDENGDTIGLMALEISMDLIDHLMQDRTGMGETGETFLVGSDLLLRSDSPGETGRRALRARIESQPVKQWFANELEKRGTYSGIREREVHRYVNHKGTEVFGAIANLENIDQFDIHWVVVAEVAETEALSLINRLRNVMLLLLVGTALVVSLISVLVARSIVSPIRSLLEWTGRVAKGEFAPVETRFEENEIGELYGGFNRMVQSFQEVATVCEAIAVGDFSKSLKLRGENDMLGIAVNQMAENLRAAVRQADLIAEGDFTVRITPWSEEDRLGKALLRMTSRLREMAEANRQALEDARRLTDYLDKLPIPVLCMDLNFRIVYINIAGAELAGFDQPSCIGRYCYEFFTNAHCRTRECRVGRSMRSKRVEQAETLVDPTGLNLPIRYTGAPVFDEHGSVIGALEYIVDISETKEAFSVIEKENWIQDGVSRVNDRLRGEQGLEQLCDNLLSGLAEKLPILAAAMYVADENDYLRLHGVYSTSGQIAARGQFGAGEGLVGQAACEKKILVISDIPAECVRMVSGTVEISPRQLVMVPLLHENRVKGCLELGALKELGEDALVFLERVSGNIAIAIGSVQARMRLAELLEETQRQARELQTQQEELQATNEELEAQTNSLKEREVELQAQHEELMTLNEELEEKTDSLQRQKADIERKNSELEEARSDIEKKAEELAITNKYKSEFMANMSHELRTPLNSLLLLSHNMVQNKDGNLTDEQVESARVMYSSGNDLLELINEILDLSKIEAGRVDVKANDIALRDLAERLRANFQPLADEKGLSLAVEVDPSAPAVITSDRQRLEQVLRNLISNAIKFTDEGGVTVTMRPLHEQDSTHREELAAENALAVSVADTGIGVPPEKQKIIFEAFQQVDGSTSRKYGGTGLGLSISRELAVLLGGEIQVASIPGQGAIFTLYLPRKLEQAEITQPSAQKSPERKRPRKILERRRDLAKRQEYEPVKIADDRDDIGEDDKTVLIIEDDLNFLKYLVKQGNEKGFKCIASAYGEDGLQLAEKFRPSAIILDINLPDMNGWLVLDALKKNRLLRHIPVHMISADEKTLDAFKKGAVGYLHKPVTQEELFRAFEQFDEFIDKDFRELLVVEDDEVLRKEIVKLIGNGDVQTTAVASGGEVIDKLRQQKFDCMILDIGLPDMTGFELLDRLEKESGIEIPPVIIYTGRELTREEHDSLYRYTDSIIVKGVKSVERLLDETALFLHRVVDKMPADKRKMIANLYEQDAMFVGKKILIVDDDMRNAFALSKILSEKQIEVFIANSGHKALEFLEEEKGIDLVLMDIMMPEMDGYETMGRIRALEKFWNLPIIALTAKAMPEDKQKCLAAGANDYLAKPIEEGRLFSVMRIWLYR